MDLFGNTLDNDAFMDFVAQYVVRRRNELAQDASYLNATAKKKNAEAMAKKYGVDVKDPVALKKKLAELNALRERWKNPYSDGELMDEIRNAWRAREGAAASVAELPSERLFREYAARAWQTEGVDYSTFHERRSAAGVWPSGVMKKIERDWMERLDDYIAEYQAAKANPNIKRPMGREIYVCPTPGVLSLVGVTSRDVVTTRHALDHDMFTKHGMTRKALLRLPRAIANPICISESQSVPGALEILTTLTETVMDSQTKALVKKNVPVALHVGLKSTESPALNVSKIASAYGKNRIKTIIDTHKILYWNTQKGTVMLNNYRLQLPQAIQHDLSTGNIWEFNDLVNYKKQETIHFSVVGQSAKNWDKIKHRAFRGRDDGKLHNLSRAYATDAQGNRLGQNVYITTPNGNLDWYRFPQDKKTQGLLAKHGVKDLPIRLKVGRQNPHEHRGFGLMHTLNHFDDMVNIKESPLLHLYNSLSNLVKIRGGAGRRYQFKSEYEGGTIAYWWFNFWKMKGAIRLYPVIPNSR